MQILKGSYRMRRLIVSTYMTLDGVIQPLDWSAQNAIQSAMEERGTYARDLLFAADALLLGRETYEIFADVWPTRSAADDGPGEEGCVDRINGLPKYVASRTLREATWNATLIRGDIAAEVVRLKDQLGQNILKYGTGELDRTLMQHNLVDEFHLWVFPVAVGAGQRLFDGIDTTHLKLVDTTRFDSGIVVLVYAPS